MSERAFGPFLFTLTPNGDPDQPAFVDVELSLNGIQLWQQRLTPTAPSATLRVDASGCTVGGAVVAVFTSATKGQLQGQQLEFAAPGFELSFTGTIDVW